MGVLIVWIQMSVSSPSDALNGIALQLLLRAGRETGNVLRCVDDALRIDSYSRLQMIEHLVRHDLKLIA
jgi:hypothetical protein